MSTTTETTTKAPEQVAHPLNITAEELQIRKQAFLNNIKK